MHVQAKRENAHIKEARFDLTPRRRRGGCKDEGSYEEESEKAHKTPAEF